MDATFITDPTNDASGERTDPTVRPPIEPSDRLYLFPPGLLIEGRPLLAELYLALKHVADVLREWRPQEPLWASIADGACDQRTRLIEDEHRHHSERRPESINALYGHYEKYPVHCALVGASFASARPSWCAFATLLAWPHIAENALGYQVTKPPSENHVHRLGRLLRDAIDGAVSEADLDRLWEVWRDLDPEGPHPFPGKLTDKAGLWSAIAAHVAAYHSTIPPHTDALPTAPGLSLPTYGTLRMEVYGQRMTEPDAEGLAPEDANALRRVAEDRPTADDPAAEDSDLLSRLFHSQFAGTREYQHLPLAWDRLSPQEVACVRREFGALEVEDECAALGLVVTLGVTPEDLAGLFLHTDEAQALTKIVDGQWHLLVVGVDQVVALHGVQIAENSYRRSAESQDGWLESSSLSAVCLPDFVSSWLARASQGRSGHLVRFFPGLAAAARRAAMQLRKRVGSRVTVGRLRCAVSQAIFQKFRDECRAARALPHAPVVVGSGIYYSSYPALELARDHQQAMVETLGWSSPSLPPSIEALLENRFVGSEILIDPDYLKKAIAALKKRAKDGMNLGRYSPQRLITTFNSITCYTLGVTLLMTSHRPTNEPFPLASDISVEHKSALVCDKRQFGMNEQRLVPLTPQAVAILSDYRHTIASAASYLTLDAPEVAAALMSLLADGPGYPSAAFFSLLELEGQTLRLRPFQRADWARYWPEWVWPLNAGRHFLTSELLCQRVSRELINHLLGHAELGQTPFNRHSTITPSWCMAELRNALTTIETKLEIQAIGSLKGYSRQGTTLSSPRFLPAPIFGDAAPSRNQHRTPTASETRFARALLRDLSAIPELKEGLATRFAPHVFDYCQGDAVAAKRLLAILERHGKGRSRRAA